MRPPNTKKETGIPRDGRTTLHLHATLRANSAPRVWKGATEEDARRGTLKNLLKKGGARVQRTGSVDLRDPACSLVGAGAQKPENIRRWDLDCVMATQR